VRAALEECDTALEGEILHRSGHPDWFARDGARPEEVHGSAAEEEARPLPLRQPETRRRLLPRRAPSALEGGARIDLPSILRLDTRAALDRGSVLHRWFEAVEWVEDGPPEESELRRLAREIAPGWEEERLADALTSFAAALRAPQIRAALSRGSYPQGASVQREVPFVWRDAEGLLEGVVDRLVIVLGPDGRPARAEVLDFKTDSVAGNEGLLRDRVAHYAPQIRAYREAVAGMYGLQPAAVEGRLLFVEVGRVERPG
jgi:ATP-dependent helicase/nuclease subunit A